MITVSGCFGLSASVARSHGAECQWLRRAAGGGACILLTPFRRTRLCEKREMRRARPVRKSRESEERDGDGDARDGRDCSRRRGSEARR